MTRGEPIYFVFLILGVLGGFACPSVLECVNDLPHGKRKVTRKISQNKFTAVLVVGLQISDKHESKRMSNKDCEEQEGSVRGGDETHMCCSSYVLCVNFHPKATVFRVSWV